MQLDCYTFGMGGTRTLPLFDKNVHPSSWNERMLPGEYAVHDSHFEGEPFCVVFSSLAEAETYARERVAEDPGLRCRIFDHQGLVGKPIREFKGGSYKGESDLSPRFRRWVGSVLFFGGIILTIVDWHADFKLLWPAMLGTRMLIPGFLLLFTEAMIVFYARRESAQTEKRAG